MTKLECSVSPVSVVWCPSCDAFLRGVPSPLTDVVERARLNTTRTDLYITMMRSSKD